MARTYRVEFCSELGYRGIYGYGRSSDIEEAVEQARKSLESKGYSKLDVVAISACCECF